MCCCPFCLESETCPSDCSFSLEEHSKTKELIQEGSMQSQEFGYFRGNMLWQQSPTPGPSTGTGPWVIWYHTERKITYIISLLFIIWVWTMLYFEKCPDSFCYISDTWHVNAKIVIMPDISFYFVVFIRHISKFGPWKYCLTLNWSLALKRLWTSDVSEQSQSGL